jgi:hypothetical protein
MSARAVSFVSLSLVAGCVVSPNLPGPPCADGYRVEDGECVEGVGMDAAIRIDAGPDALAPIDTGPVDAPMPIEICNGADDDGDLAVDEDDAGNERWLCFAFGSTDITGERWTTPTGDTSRVAPYANDVPIIARAIWLRAAGNFADQTWRGVIYTSGEGVPDTLVAASESIVIAPGSDRRWLRFPFTEDVPLDAVTYYLGSHSADPSDVSEFGIRDIEGMTGVYSLIDEFDDGPDSPYPVQANTGFMIEAWVERAP